MRFVEEGVGKIDLSSEVVEEEGVVFTVRDNGIGIEDDQVDIIFEKFNSAGGRRTSMVGSGLGLSIAKGIVELHGGKIWVDKSVKPGACFKFSLPYLK